MWFRAWSCFLLGIWLLLALPAAEVQAQGAMAQLKAMSDQFATIVEQVRPSVVHISAYRKISPSAQIDPFETFRNDPFWRFFFDNHPFFEQDPRLQRPNPDQEPSQPREVPAAMGSGVIVSRDGHVLTNEHVIKDADRVTVVLSDNTELEAEVVGTDDRTDIAVLKITGNNLPVARLGDSDALRVGEWVLAVGNPFYLDQTVTFGIVSALGRNIFDDRSKYQNFIQTDAAINPGNSGGPLLNLDGEVVGINNAIVTRSGGSQGIGLAIPINIVKDVMSDLISKGKVDRGWLGVQIMPLNGDLAESFGLDSTQGALVSKVMPDTPASAAGLQDGDVILTWDGKPVRDHNHLRNLVAATNPDSIVKVGLVRKGKRMEVDVKITAQDEKLVAAAERGESAQAGSGKKVTLGPLGFSVVDLTDELADKYGYAKKYKAVMVSEVELGSPAARAGINTGDLVLSVNQQEVKTARELERAIGEIKKGDRVLLYLQNRDSYRWVTLRAQ